MPTTEERMRILKMVSDKQITAEEGADLLDALRVGDAEARDSAEPGSARWLRVRVTDRMTGKTKVHVNVPMGLVEAGLKMGARFAPDMSGMDLQAIHGAFKSGYQGKIVDVDDQEKNERVEVFVE
jgi:hypothetical protein